MKGIVVDYFIDKGFGFIMDENKDRRFFHITNITERDKFLNNLTDYYFTDYEESRCYVVNFNPSHNEKGLNAVSINLTNQIFNEKANCEFEVKIIDIKYNTESFTRIVSGISKEMSLPFGATVGGNGTYRIGYPEVIRELNIYLLRTDDIGWGTIDVRELFLKLNKRSKITDKVVDILKKKLLGTTLMINQVNDEWILKDNSILEI